MSGSDLPRWRRRFVVPRLADRDGLQNPPKYTYQRHRPAPAAPHTSMLNPACAQPRPAGVDFNDKRAEYAAQGIPVYLIVVMEEDRIGSIEEYRLDWSGRNYQLAAVHRSMLVTELPEGMKIDISFADLERI